MEVLRTTLTEFYGWIYCVLYMIAVNIIARIESNLGHLRMFSTAQLEHVTNSITLPLGLNGEQKPALDYNAMDQPTK